MALYIVANVVSSIANSLSYKQMLNKYKSSAAPVMVAGELRGSHSIAEHNYEFFANQ